MRSLSRRFGRAAALVALLAILVAQGVDAADRNRDRGTRFERAKRFIVSVFSRIGYPPG